jgi:hypothetical protein
MPSNEELLSLGDEEMQLLIGLASPIAYGRRREFIEAVAAAVEQAGVGSGVGLGAPGGARSAEELRACHARSDLVH